MKSNISKWNYWPPLQASLCFPSISQPSYFFNDLKLGGSMVFDILYAGAAGVASSLAGAGAAGVALAPVPPPGMRSETSRPAPVRIFS